MHIQMASMHSSIRWMTKKTKTSRTLFKQEEMPFENGKVKCEWNVLNSANNTNNARDQLPSHCFMYFYVLRWRMNNDALKWMKFVEKIKEKRKKRFSTKIIYYFRRSVFLSLFVCILCLASINVWTALFHLWNLKKKKNDNSNHTWRCITIFIDAKIKSEMNKKEFFLFSCIVCTRTIKNKFEEKNHFKSNKICNEIAQLWQSELKNKYSKMFIWFIDKVLMQKRPKEIKKNAKICHFLAVDSSAHFIYVHVQQQ